ncbi:hypothetical protein BRADI_2g18325v3, partial [Brachypodium distachyon]
GAIQPVDDTRGDGVGGPVRGSAPAASPPHHRASAWCSSRPAPRALQEEGCYLVRRAHMAMEHPRLFSSGSKHPCKFNPGNKKHKEGANRLPQRLEDHFARIEIALEKEVHDWREMRKLLAQSKEVNNKGDKVTVGLFALFVAALFGGEALRG